jgi:hypothetical protein
MNTFAAVAALVVALGAGSAYAADATAGASGAGSAGVSTDTSNTNANAAGNTDVNAAANTGGTSAGASGSVGASGELGIDLAGAGADVTSRQQFFASLSADQQADVRARCTAAGSDKASIEASSLSADAKAMCEAVLNVQ